MEETGGELAIGLAQAHNHTAQGAERQSPVEETGSKFVTGRQQTATRSGERLGTHLMHAVSKSEEKGSGADSVNARVEEASQKSQWKSEAQKKRALLELSQFDSSQFLWSEGYASLEEAIRCRPRGVRPFFWKQRFFESDGADRENLGPHFRH